MKAIPPIDITDAMLTSSTTVETAPAAYAGDTTYRWDISTGVYAGKSLLVAGQDGNPTGLAFSADGTKAYVVGDVSNAIYQYTLATAWDISTGSYASKSLSVAAQEITPRAIAFSADGTKAYVVGITNDTIYQYTLATAWDISTGTYATKSLSVAAQDATPRGLVLSADGTKAYIVGGVNNTIYQYTLATAWDISTGTYATKSLSVAAQDTAPQCLSISPDGTTVFVSGNTNDTIYQYTLSTAWDISTGTYASKNLSTGARDASMTGIALSPDGTKLYLVGYNNQRVFQYDLAPPTVSVADVPFTWDVDVGVYSYKSLPVVAQDAMPQDIAFSTDGTKAYIMGEVNNAIYQYTLATAWDISTGSYSGKSLSVAAQDTVGTSIVFSSDGTKVFIVGALNDTIYQYTLATAWDISTGTYATKSLSVAAQDATPTGLAFSADGTKAYVIGLVNNTIYQYTLITAWDISTGSYASKSLSVAAQEPSAEGLAFNADGTKAFVIGVTNDTIYQYTLATAWDISTGTYSGKSLSVAAQEIAPRGLAFSGDGTKIYVTGNGSTAIAQYALPGSGSIGVVKVYRSLQATNVGHTPASSPTWWMEICETYPVYSATSAYSLGQRAIDTTNHLVYESLVYGNIGQALTNETKWLEIGPTNKWAMFDLLRNTRSIAPLHLQAVVTPGLRADSIALMGVVADTARVMVLRGGEIFYDYTEDLAARSALDWADYDYPALPTNPSTVLFDLPVEYDLSGGVYASKSLSVTSQDTAPAGLAFSSDGTKAYVVGDVSNAILQYTLTTAWDISTGSYASKSLSVAVQISNPVGLAFSSDGTKAYVMSYVDETIYQYTLSTAWDISTGSYASKSLSVAAQTTQAYGIAVSADGTKIYAIDNAAVIYQYTLTTPWDISTGSYASKSLSVSAQEVAPYSLSFSPDGAKVCVVGTASRAIIQYNLSIAWDISTGTYASRLLPVSAQVTIPTGLAFSADGSKAYVTDFTSDAIYQYTMPPDDASSSVVKVEFYKATGNVEVGACVLGNAVYIGGIQYDAESDVLNFSNVTRDFAGATALMVRRRNVPKTIQQLQLPNSRINAVRALRDHLNAAPAVWSGIDDHDEARFDAMLILGFYKRFTMRMSLTQHTIIDLELEEI